MSLIRNCYCETTSNRSSALACNAVAPARNAAHSAAGRPREVPDFEESIREALSRGQDLGGRADYGDQGGFDDDLLARI